MTHIGIDARLIHYRIGGISTYIRQLIHALAQLDFANQYTILHSRRSDELLDPQFKHRKLWTPPHHRLEKFALTAELLSANLDLLHSPDFIPPLRGAKRHIITVHDLTFLHYPEHKDASAKRYYNDQIVWAVRHADHILAVSQATKHDLMTMLHVPQDKITVQPHGVDEKFKPIAREQFPELRQKLNLPEDYILFVGTLEPRKNIPALLDAYEQLHNPPPLVLAGKIGWLFDETLARVQSMTNLILRHDIGDADLPALYNLASMLILPSFYEGFGMPVLEAMACGTPVIVSNNSSLPEVAGDAGLMIAPDRPEAIAEAIEKLLNDTALVKELRQRGIQRAAQFSWANSAQIALSAYALVM